jgi:hypothetical protein
MRGTFRHNLKSASQPRIAAASALEQQDAAMREISGNAQNASHALGNINQHVKAIAAG